eukprot:3018291-Heterocapsa_arctica.AAC.1
MTILGPTGQPAASDSEAADLLRNHWAPVFDDKEIDQAALQQLLQRVRRVPGGVTWRMEREDFHAMA